MRRILFVAIFLLISDIIHAQCTIDIRDLTVCGTCSDQNGTGEWGQTFVACADGNLSAIQIVTNADVAASDGLDLVIYSGDPASGSVIGTIQDVVLTAQTSGGGPFISADYSSIDVSSLGLIVNNSSTYSFEFVGGVGGVNLFYEGADGTDNYANGEAYLNGSTAASQGSADTDLYFEVDIAANTTPTALFSLTSSGPYEGLVYTFVTADFGFSDVDNNTLDHIRITAIPGAGTLYLDANNNDTNDGEDVAANDLISLADLNAGNLQYVQSGATNTSFTFDVNDGLDYSATTYSANLTIIAEPTVTLSAISPASRLESTSTANVVEAQLSHAFALNTTVTLGFTGTATNVDDYTRSATSITITAGATSGSITLSNVADALYEGNETVIVDITGVTNGTEDGTQQETFTITDDDSQPSASLLLRPIYDPIADESGGQVYVVAVLDAVTGVTTTVPLSFSGTATGGGTDYSLSNTNIVINPGFDKDSILVTSIFDGLVEGDETIIVDMDAPTNATEDGTQQITLTITDEDCVAPSAASSIVFGATSKSTINLASYTAGSGDGYAIFINSANSFTAPSDGDEPTADLSWNNAGQQPIYFGTSSSPGVTVTGLDAATTYYFVVYSYLDCGGLETYETTGVVNSTSTSANSAPTSSDFSLAGGINTIATIQTSDITYNDTDGDALVSVDITTLPGVGTLFLDANDNGVNDTEDVTAGDDISKADLDADRLKYETTSSAGNTTFSFTVFDGTDPSSSQTATLYSVENALDFDGTGSKVTLSDDASIQPSSAFTLEAWVYPTTVSGNQRILAKYSGAGTTDGELVFDMLDDDLRILFYNGGSVSATAANVLTVNEWQHVVARYDGGNTLLELYLNGSLVAQNASATATIPDVGTVWTIGEDDTEGSSAEYFQGLIDNVRIWTTTRTAEEIRSNATALLSSGTGLGASYLFNQGIPDGTNSGETTLIDETGTNSGGLSGFALTGTSSNWVESDALSSTAATSPNIAVYQGVTIYPSGGTTFSFNDTGDGSTTDITFTIVNEGFADLSLNGSLALDDNTNYAFVTPYTPTITVGAGLTQDFTVRFQPQTVGTFSASVTVPSNDADGSYDLNITGDGIDLTPPVFENSTPAVDAVFSTGFTLNTDIDEGGTVYYVVVPANDSQPNVAEIQLGQASGGGGAVASGNQDVSGITDFIFDFSVTGLSALTTYDIYVFAEDDESTPNEQSSGTLIEDVTTAGNNSTLTAVASSEADFFNSGAYDGTSGALTTANSVQVFQFTVADETGDGLPTLISSLDVAITSNSASIKAIGLYDVTGTSFVAQSTGGSTPITLTPSSDLSIADNASTTYAIYVSFNSSPTEGQYEFTVNNIVQPTNSTEISTSSVVSSTSGDENTVDNTSPTVTSLEIFDTDNDGYIDAINIIFDEPIDTDDGSSAVFTDIGTLILPDGSQVVTTNSTPTVTSPAFVSGTVTITGIDVLDHTSEIENTAAGSTSIDGLTGFWVDRAGNAILAAGDDSESIIDSALPVLISSAPADNSLSFSPSANFEFQFSEDIAIGASGTRTVDVYEITGGPNFHESIDISGETPSGNTITLTPSVAFTLSNEYAIQISVDAIDDLAGNSYAGISNNDDLDFIVDNTAPSECGFDYANDGDVDNSGSNDGHLRESQCNDEPASISSLIDTGGEAISVFYFNLINGSNSAENVSSIVFRNPNSLDWSLVIAGAQLINEFGVSESADAITANTITFSPGTGNGELGDLVGDGNEPNGMEYALRIWLKSDMTTLANSIDGEFLEFELRTDDMANVNRVYDTLTTDYEDKGAYNISSGAIEIIVSPTHYGFEQQPTDTEARQVMTPAVTVEAQDINGNRDEDYAGTEILTIETSGSNLEGTPTTTAAFSGGLATVDDIVFTTDVGNTGITLNVLDNTEDVLDVSNSSSTFTISADATAPIVSVGAISITSTGSGLAGEYIVGDKVTAEWDNTVDGNIDVASVDFDFGEFGASVDVVGVESAGVWSASYTIVDGSIDATNRNVTVKVTDDSSSPNQTSLAGDDNVTVDNIRPTINTYNPLDDAADPSTSAVAQDATPNVATDASFTITFDQPVTASFGSIDITSYEDQAGDLQSVAANNTTYVNVSGSTVTITPPNALTGTRDYYVQIDGKSFYDASGNYFEGIFDIVTWNFGTEADNVPPVPTVTVQDPGVGTTSITSATEVVYEIRWNEEIDGMKPADVTLNLGSGVTGTGDLSQEDLQTFLYKISGLTGDDTISISINNNSGLIADASTNKFLGTFDSDSVVIDQTKPVLSVNDLTTLDNTPPLTGSVDEDIAVTVRVDGFDYTNTSNAVNGLIYDWTLPDDEVVSLSENTYNVIAYATDEAGNLGQASGTLKLDLTAPTINYAVYFDTDGDGNIDEILIRFSEAIDDATLEDADFTVTGATGVSIGNNAGVAPNDIANTNDATVGSSLKDPRVDNDRFITLEITGLTGTAPVNVDYAQGGADNLADLVGNELLDDNDITEVDRADPIVLRAYEYDSDQDGNIEEVVVEFSEGVQYSSALISEYFVGGANPMSIVSHNDKLNPLDAESTDEYITLEVAITGTAAVEVELVSTSTRDNNSQQAVSNNAITEEDRADPVIIEVTSTATNSSGPSTAYEEGSVIPITVDFSEDITVGGAGVPEFGLNSSASASAIYNSQSSDLSIFNFNYTVASNDESDDLDYDDGESVALNGLTWQDAAGNDALLTLPTAGATGSLGFNKDLIIDALAPAFLYAYQYDITGGANGTIDEIVIELTEGIDISTVQASDFTINGSTTGHSLLAAAGTANGDDTADDDEFITFSVNIASTAPVTVAYAQSTLVDLRDLAGNLAANDAGITEVDLALPVFLGAYYYDTEATPDGNIDEIVIEFSEPVVESTVESNDFTLTSGSVLSTATHAGGGISNLLDVDDDDEYVTLEVSLAGTATTNLAYNRFAGGASATEDASGNEAGNNSVINTFDEALPVFLNAYFYDTEGTPDGNVDEIVLEFSEEIDESTIVIGNYSLSGTGSSINSLSTVASGFVANSLDAADNDQYATLEVAFTGTGTNTLSYTQGTTADLAANLAATIASINEVDKAFPVFLNAYQYDLSAGSGADGTIDEIVVQISESINIATVQASDFTLGSGSVISFYSHASNSVDIDNTQDVDDNDAYYTLEVSTNTTAAVSVNYAQSSANDIADGAGNLIANNSSIGIVDEAAPVALTAFQYDISADGNIDEIVIMYSESVNFSDAENVDFSVDTTSLDGTNGLVVNEATALNTLDISDTDSYITLSVTTAVVTGTATVRVDYSGAGGSLQINDGEGNNAVDVNAISENDQAVPRVINIQSSNVDGTYKEGDVITVDVIYSERVNVATGGGTPTLRLQTGPSATQTINYSSVLGDTLSFAYTVLDGDESADLDYAASGSLTLNGGTILDRSSNANSANNTLFAPGAGSVGAGSLAVNKDLVVDGVIPSIIQALQFDTDNNGTIDEIVIEVSEPIDETSVSSALASTQFGLGAGTITGISLAGDASKANDLDKLSDDQYLTLEVTTLRTSTVSVSYTAGTFADLAGNLVNSVTSITANDQAVPVITNVTSSVANAAYNELDNIPIQVTFSELVDVDELGTPQLTLETGTVDQVVNLTSGTGSATLTFNYIVQANDQSLDLAYLSITALTAGISIKDQSTQANDADLTLPAIGGAGSLNANKNIVIDTQAPNITTLTIASDNATPTLAKGDDPNSVSDAANVVTISMDFDDDLSGTPIVQVRSGGSFVSNTPTINTIAADQYTATYTVSRDDADGRVYFTINYTDKAGNAGTELDTLDITSGSTITVDNTSPTVEFSVADDPTSEASFTVTANFSETIVGLGSGDFISSDGSVGTINGTSSPYTFDVTPSTGQTDTLTVGMIDEGVTDEAGNTIVATSIDVAFDDEAPIINGGTLVNGVDYVVFGQDLTMKLNLSEVGTIYYALVPDGTTATSAEVKAQSIAAATSEGSIDFTSAGSEKVRELSLPLPRTDYDLLLVSEDKVNPTPYNLSGITTIDITSGGVQVTTPAINDFCLEGDFRTLDPIVIRETIETDFVSSGASRTIRLLLPDFDDDGITDFVYDTVIVASVSAVGGDVINPSLSYTNTSILVVNYEVPSTNNLDVLTISGLRIRATGEVTSSAKIERSGGTGNVYLANDGDGAVFATLNTVAPYDAPEVLSSASEPGTFTSPYIFEISSGINSDEMGDGVTVYDKDDVLTSLTPFRVGLPSAGDVVTVYADADLTSMVTSYTAVANEDNSFAPQLSDLGLDDTNVGVNTFYITTTDGLSCESASSKFSVAIIRFENSESKTGFAVTNSSGTTLKYSYPSNHSVIITGEGLTSFNSNNDFGDGEDGYSVKFIPSAAEQGTTTVVYQLTNDTTNVTANYGIDFLVIESDRVLSTSGNQAVDYCQYDDPVSLNMVSPLGIDYNNDPDGNTMDQPNFKTVRVYLYDSDTEARGTDITDILTTQPVNYPNDTLGWVFDPSGVDSLLVGDVYSQELLFVYVIEDDGTLEETDLSAQVITVYREPSVTFTNINDYYCNDDGDFDISVRIVSASGTDTDTVEAYHLYKHDGAGFNIDLGYRNNAGFDPANPDGDALSYPNEEEFGLYRIVYTSPLLTNASCSSTDTVEFQILEIPDLPPLDETYFANHSDGDIGGVYTIEYCAGQTVESLAIDLSSFDAADSVKVKWYNDVNLSSPIASSHISGTNSDSLNLATAFFGGNSEPTGRQNITFYYTITNNIDLDGSEYSGCESEAKTVSIQVYPYPDDVEAKNLISSTTTNTFNSKNVAGEYLYEYCESDNVEVTLNDIDLDETLNTEDATESYFILYDADTVQKARFQNADTLTDSVIKNIFSYTALDSTSLVFYVSQRNFDNNYPVDAGAEFSGCEGDLRKFTIDIHAIPNVPDASSFNGDQAVNGVVDYYLCSGESLQNILTPQLEGAKYNWYKDDGTGSPSTTLINVAGFNDNFITQSELVAAGFSTTVTTDTVYTYWVTQTLEANTASGFKGCESEATRVNITVFPDPVTPTVSDASGAGLIDDSGIYKASFCVGSVDFEFDISGLTSGENFNEEVRFNVYSVTSNGQLSTTAIYTDTTSTGTIAVTDADLRMSQQIAGTYSFKISQVNSTVGGTGDGAVFTGCETSVDDMATLTLYLYDVPDSPEIQEDLTNLNNNGDDHLIYYNETDVISDISVFGENGVNNIYRWYLADNDSLVFADTTDAGLSTASATQLGISGVGVYDFYVNQTSDFGAGVAGFTGCASESEEFTVTIFAIPSAPVATDPTPQCNENVTPNSTKINYYGVSTQSQTSTEFVFSNEEGVLFVGTGGSAVVESSSPTVAADFTVDGVQNLVIDGFNGDLVVDVVQRTNIINNEFAGSISDTTEVTITIAPIPIIGNYGTGPQDQFKVIEACDEANVVLDMKLENLSVGEASFNWYAGQSQTLNESIIPVSSTVLGTNEIRFEFDPEAAGLGEGDKFFKVEVTDSSRPDGLSGCIASASMTFEIGSSPNPKIRWVGITEGKPITLVFGDDNISSSANYWVDSVHVSIDAINWSMDTTFNQTPGIDSDSLWVVNDVIFNNSGDYEMTVRYISGSACVGDASRTISVLDHFVVTDEILFGFDGSDDGRWLSEETNGFNSLESSWELGSGEFDGNTKGNGQYWVTGDQKAYDASAQSWVYSPSFDISGMSNPTIGFSHIRDLNFTDGVVLQQSTNDGRSWSPVGTFEDGLGSGKNWYTTEQISGSPGDEGEGYNRNAYAWSTKPTSEDAGWNTTAHRINTKPEQIRFRFALGSTGGNKVESDNVSPQDGFAFDDFSIYNKEKFILIEQFSNFSATSVEVVDSVTTRVENSLSTDAILLNYYVGDLGITGRTSADPAARSTYYGVAAAPQSIISGINVANEDQLDEVGDITGWNENYYNSKALDFALFDIGDISLGADPAKLDISTTFTYSEQGERLPEGTELSFRFAIVEKEINDSELMSLNGGKPLKNVLRKMLPTTGGYTYKGVVIPGQSIFFNDSPTVSASWEISDIYDPAELRVIAFVQVDNLPDSYTGTLLENRLILQAKVVDVEGKILPEVTGVNRVLNIDHFHVYPNPANSLFKVQLEKAPTSDMNWVIYDQVGREVLLGAIKPGELEIEIDSKDLPSGMYMIHLFNQNEQWTPKRVVIIH